MISLVVFVLFAIGRSDESGSLTYEEIDALISSQIPDLFQICLPHGSVSCDIATVQYSNGSCDSNEVQTVDMVVVDRCFPFQEEIDDVIDLNDTTTSTTSTTTTTTTTTSKTSTTTTSATSATINITTTTWTPIVESYFVYCDVYNGIIINVYSSPNCTDEIIQSFDYLNSSNCVDIECPFDAIQAMSNPEKEDQRRPNSNGETSDGFGWIHVMKTNAILITSINTFILFGVV